MTPTPRDAPSSAFLRGQEHPVLQAAPGAPHDIVFLDRDGTLNALLPGYRTPSDFLVLPGVPAAVARLNAAGLPVVLATNQQGLATGRLTWQELEQVHALLLDTLRSEGGWLDDIRLCPHATGTCGCRKPRPGLLQAALADNAWAVPQRCVLVGDADSDEEAARAASVGFHRVNVQRSLSDVVDDLLAHGL